MVQNKYSEKARTVAIGTPALYAADYSLRYADSHYCIKVRCTTTTVPVFLCYATVFTLLSVYSRTTLVVLMIKAVNILQLYHTCVLPGTHVLHSTRNDTTVYYTMLHTDGFLTNHEKKKRVKTK